MNTDKIYAQTLASEYAPKDNSKLIRLRKLDRRAKLPGVIFTYTMGIVSALVFGTGMCLAMHVIGGDSLFLTIFGVLVGLIGLLGCGINYPIYQKLIENGKQKYAFEIMELAREIEEEA